MIGTSALRRNIFYPLWVAKDRSPRLRVLKDLERSQYLAAQELRDLQVKRLRDVVAYAHAEVPFYRDMFDRLGFKPSDFRSERDLKSLPVIGKLELRNHQQRFLARSANQDLLTSFKTGGSTGTPVEVLKDSYSVELANAAALRVFRWAGWKIGEPVAMVWGNPPDQTSLKERLLNAFIAPSIYLDTMSLTDESMREFVSRWQRVRPTMIRGHSHSIYIFASYCRAHAVDIVRPAAIISSSMMLLPSERRVIEETFRCRVTDLYGCEEVGLIACECELHRGMHIDAENVYVELLDADGNDSKSGEDGAVVVTSLHNGAMPLIRYRMGDVASFADRSCGCGRGLPMLKSIAGRVADFLVRRDGSVVAGVSLVERTLTKIQGIAQMQIVQEDLDNVLLRLVKDENYSDETQRLLAEEFRSSVGEYVNIRLEFVGAIPQEKSGKYRFAISKVPNPFG